MNQQNLYLFPPTAVAWLLQYSGSKDGFSSHKWLAMKFKMVNLFWILGFDKNNKVEWLKTENKIN